MIHHKDHDHDNNDIENLQVTHYGCHTRHHWTGKQHTDETKSKLAVHRVGKPLSDETKAKMSAATKGKSKSEETRRRMSEAAKNRSPEHLRKIREGLQRARERRNEVQ